MSTSSTKTNILMCSRTKCINSNDNDWPKRAFHNVLWAAWRVGRQLLHFADRWNECCHESAKHQQLRGAVEQFENLANVAVQPRVHALAAETFRNHTTVVATALQQSLEPLNVALTLLAAYVFAAPDGERWSDYVESLHRVRERIESALSCVRG